MQPLPYDSFYGNSYGPYFHPVLSANGRLAIVYALGNDGQVSSTTPCAAERQYTWGYQSDPFQQLATDCSYPLESVHTHSNVFNAFLQGHSSYSFQSSLLVSSREAPARPLPNQVKSWSNIQTWPMTTELREWPCQAGLVPYRVEGQVSPVTYSTTMRWPISDAKAGYEETSGLVNQPVELPIIRADPPLSEIVSPSSPILISHLSGEASACVHDSQPSPSASTVTPSSVRSMASHNLVDSVPISRQGLGAWSCDICNGIFRRRQRALVHYLNKHMGLRIECKGECGVGKCTSSFSGLEGLDTHSKSGKMDCTECGRSVLKKNILRHRRNHCHPPTSANTDPPEASPTK